MGTAGNIIKVAGALLVLEEAVDAQLPFYTGTTPPPYKNIAAESRLYAGEDDWNAIQVFKAFPEIGGTPLWIYLGSSYGSEDGFGDVFHGIGQRINIDDKFYTLFTLDGSNGKFTGASAYSTLLLGKYFLDFSPGVSQAEGDVSKPKFSMPVNIGKNLKKGVDLAFSFNYKDKKIKDSFIRASFSEDGNFVDAGVGIDPGRKVCPKNLKFRFAVQRSFGKR